MKSALEFVILCSNRWLKPEVTTRKKSVLPQCRPQPGRRASIWVARSTRKQTNKQAKQSTKRVNIWRLRYHPGVDMAGQTIFSLFGFFDVSLEEGEIDHSWEWKGNALARRDARVDTRYLHPVWPGLNPFTPKSDQFQISPAASPEILHYTVWRTWLFIACSDESWLY